MDIEQLSKSQVVLLTLLVTFVTSIATGIVTVSLMQQAPPAIAQTVNRVVERTVEKIVPTSQTASVITQEKTVVVKEADLIAQAVSSVSPALVRLYTSGSSDISDASFIGLGVVVGPGRVVADTAALGDLGDATGVLSDGTSVRLFVTARDTENSVAFLDATSTASAKAPTWHAIPLATHPLLGTTVIALSGKSAPRVAEGIVTALTPRSSGAQAIETDISDSSIMRGSPLINTDGALLGISTWASRNTASSAFISAEALRSTSGQASGGGM